MFGRRFDNSYCHVSAVRNFRKVELNSTRLQPVSPVPVSSARQSVVVLGEHTASRADGQRRVHCG